MADPSEKSEEIDNGIKNLFGVNRVDAIKSDRCTLCSGPAFEFKDKLSTREYQISGLCQVCQDSIF